MRVVDPSHNQHPMPVFQGDIWRKKISHLSPLPALFSPLTKDRLLFWVGPYTRKEVRYSEHLGGPGFRHTGHQPTVQEVTTFKRVTFIWGSERQVNCNNSASHLHLQPGNCPWQLTLITMAPSGGQVDIMLLCDTHFSKEGNGAQRKEGACTHVQ